MEDGAFLGTVIREVVHGSITLSEAISLYEQKRMPRVWAKKQISFISGVLNMAGGDEAQKRNQASRPEIEGLSQSVVQPYKSLPPQYRSWQLWINPFSVPSIMNYDAEGDADQAVIEYLQSNTKMDETTFVTKGLFDRYLGFVDRNGVGDRVEMVNGVSEDVKRSVRSL